MLADTVLADGGERSALDQEEAELEKIKQEEQQKKQEELEKIR